MLDKIPQVPIVILEYGYGAVWSLLGLTHECYPERTHLAVVPPAVVCSQKEEDPDASLTADA